jgi:hypothetical protein
MNLITNYVGRIPSITADVGALIGRLGVTQELGEIRDSLIETENVSTDELLQYMNQIQHGIFMHNGVILTQQQYFMMVHNYVSERNMDIDRISHRIYRIIHNIPGFIPIIPFIEDDGEQHNVGGKPRRKPRRKTVSNRRKSKKQVRRHRTPKRTRAKPKSKSRAKR